MLQCMVVMWTRGSSKLTAHKRKELIFNLCRAFVTLQSPKEVADALTDLFMPKEVETIAKRLRIAEMLVEGKNYTAIRAELSVGYSTIARVNTWLNLSGEGFKIMLKRKKKSPKDVQFEERYDPFSWHNIKRRYSMYFWPQLLIEELLKNADKKEKEKIHDIFNKLEFKRRQFDSEENRRLYEQFASKINKK